MGADQRIASADGLYTYADASVFFGALEVGEEPTATNPVVLVEVLSDSTRSDDRGEKLDRYRTIPSLQQVVLVEPDAPDVETWTRGPTGWTRIVSRCPHPAERRAVQPPARNAGRSHVPSHTPRARRAWAPEGGRALAARLYRTVASARCDRHLGPGVLV